MRVATGKIRGGQVVLDGEGEPLPEGHRVTVVVEGADEGFRLDAQSRAELLDAMKDLDAGNFVTKDQLLAELKAAK